MKRIFLLAVLAGGSVFGGRVLLDTEKTFVFGPGQGKDYSIKLDPDWGVLSLAGEIKTDGLVQGKDDWMNGRVPMSFHDAKGKMVGGWPDVFGFAGTRDWAVCQRDFTIPKGATLLKIGFRNFGKAGKASYKPFKLSVKRNRGLARKNAALPDGVEGDPWSLEGAWRESSKTRRRVCLNGLWGWRQVLEGDAKGAVPGANDCWGWIKVPGVWNSAKHWERNAQEWIRAEFLEDNPVKVADPETMWYRRDFVFPEVRAGERAAITFTMLQTRAEVWVDGKLAATVAYPGGEADVTEFVRPGVKQSVAIKVSAYPLNPETLDFNAPDRADARKSTVQFRGITGDAYLDVGPRGARIADATAEARLGPDRVRFRAECAGLAKGKRYVLAVTAEGCGERRTFESAAMAAGENGELAFEAEWRGVKRWDTHTPGNMYACRYELRDAGGLTLDETLPVKFGFREFKCAGKDLKLNGKTIHLRALHNRNMNSGASAACKKSALEMCRRLKGEGYNFIIAGNYNYSAGSITHMDALLDACDETGMLFSYSLPHMRDFRMKMWDEKVYREFEKLTKWAISRARNHPSVVTYGMNHNATGYVGDMNPLKIDGVYELGGKDVEGVGDWYKRVRTMAKKMAATARAMDGTRAIYHHESGNLDDFHTVNIYLNWSPVQERSDWLEHWSGNGVKPLFFVEWGMPHISSWSSYRGPLFIWTNPGYQSLWASEYAAAFLGDAAYEGDSEATVKALEMEEKLWAGAEGGPFRWSSMLGGLRGMTNHYYGVQALYMADNMRSHRAWGISAILPWDQEAFHRAVRQGAEAENPDRWKNLKQPGMVPDRFMPGRWDTGEGNAADHEPTAVGRTMLRWNGEDCAFIGGDGVFTDKRHHYSPGEKVRKTLVMLNDRREAQTVKWECVLAKGGKALERRAGKMRIEAGCRGDGKVEFTLPKEAGEFRLEAKFEFEGGAVQRDGFGLESIAAGTVKSPSGLALYDPAGLTAKEFDRLGVKYARTDLQGAFGGGANVAVGRGGLTAEIFRKLTAAAKAGANVLIFEQTKEALESVGFRVQNYGLRNAFVRYRDEGLAGLRDGRLRDWSGEATLLPKHLEGLPEHELSYARESWAGFSNTRTWRCGNRGCVASVLPEKPTAGDWRALADGGFDLQYAPLLDWAVDRGRITFCQMDVTGRTVADPAADNLVRALVTRMNARGNGRTRRPQALGRRAWIAVRDLGVGLNENAQDWGSGLYVVSSGAKRPEHFFKRIAEGGAALCLGLTAAEVNEFSPEKLEMEPARGRYAGRIERAPRELRGLSNADWQWHGAMDFDAFAGESAEGNCAVRVVRHGKGAIVFWQVPPWKFDTDARPYLRTSRRRADWMLSRILGNLGCVSLGREVRYCDVPVAEDDPYRYYRW